MFKFTNGQFVKDRITGFCGVITGRVDYISGCQQYVVQPQSETPEKWHDGKWFDEDRLVVDAAKAPMSLVVETNGFGDPAPVK